MVVAFVLGRGAALRTVGVWFAGLRRLAGSGRAVGPSGSHQRLRGLYFVRRHRGRAGFVGGNVRARTRLSRPTTQANRLTGIRTVALHKKSVKAQTVPYLYRVTTDNDTRTSPFSTSGRRILVIDDEPSIRRVVRDALREDVPEVLEARSGEEALTIAAAERPDLIV